MYSIMWECQWDKICKTDVEVRGHVDSYSIKCVDVQSLYPYVCKSKHIPVGHPRCLIGLNLRGLDVNSYE